VSAATAPLARLLAVDDPTRIAGLRAESTIDPATAFDPIAFEASFGAAGRRFGTAPVDREGTVSDDAGHTWSIAGWGSDEAARVLLLVEGMARIPPGDQLAWLEGLWRAGALRERQAVLRGLALLPEPARFLPIALDACRASTQPIFDAIACENPYPAAYFPESSFNHLVLKAVFTEVPLARILGLAGRRNADLARMAADYASERAAAGRPVPADLALVMDA
jgi:hypothetical protein